MKSKAAEILNNLYGLITDINYNKPDEDVLSDLKEKPEPFVEEQLMRVKRSIAKHKAEASGPARRAAGPRRSAGSA